MSADSDRNLIVGLLALQLDFINQDQLVTALLAWNQNKAEPLEAVFLEQKLVDTTTAELITSLVEQRTSLEKELAVSLVGEKELDALNTEIESSKAPELYRSIQTLLSSDGMNAGQSAASGTEDSNTLIKSPSAVDPGNSAVETQDGAGIASTFREDIYQVLRLHAQGGLGEVFVAHDRELNRQVALKQIRVANADDLAARNRFLLEAEVTGRLEHPGVVPVYGMGKYPDGRPYYAMRFIRGNSLKDEVKKFHASNQEPYSGAIGLALRKLLDRFTDVCETIEYAHSRGVLHRDLKPDNIMLGPYGETLVVDWGLAKAAGRSDGLHSGGEATLLPNSASGSAPTMMGSVIGTPAFMSPEQARGQLDMIGPASDVYSLGATLYYILTGKIAALGDATDSQSDVQSILDRVGRGTIPPPRECHPKLPKALNAICAKAMRHDPDERYRTAMELAEDVERFLADEPVAAHPDSFATKAKRWIKNHQTLAASVASVVVLSTIGLGIFSSLLRAKQNELAQANQDLTVAEKVAVDAAANAEARRSEAEAAKSETEAALLAEQLANKNLKQFSVFLQNQILATAKPKGAGGLGREVTVIDALEEAEKSVPDIFAKTPSAEMTVRDGLASTWHSLGMLDRAEENAKRAVELVKQLNFSDDSYLHVQGTYASILREQGKYEQAIEVGRQVVKGFESFHGSAHESTLTAVSNLGITLTNAGKLGEARKIYDSAYATAKSLHGLDHPSSFPIQTNFAEVLREGDSEDRIRAGRMMENLSKAQLEQLGEMHPESIIGANNLATFRAEEGDFDNAIVLMQSVVDRQAVVLGEDHPDRIVAISNLGLMTFQAGNPIGLKVLKQAWEIAEGKLGAKHPISLNSLDLYANSLASTGELDDALPLIRQVVDGFVETLGMSNPDTLTAINNLANAYEQVGNLESAIAWQEKVVEAGRKIYGSEHPQNILWSINYARLLASSGRLEEASDLMSVVATIKLEVDGEESEETWEVHQELANMLSSAGRNKDALKVYDRVRTWMSQAGIAESDPRILNLWLIGSLVLRQDDQVDASVSRLQSLVELFEREFPKPDDSQRMQLRGYFAELATGELLLGRYESAEQHAASSLDIAQELIPEDWRTANAESLLGASYARQGDLEKAKPLLESGHDGITSLQDYLPSRIVLASFDRLIWLFGQLKDDAEMEKWRTAKEAYQSSGD